MPSLAYETPKTGKVTVPIDKDVMVVGRSRQCEIMLKDDSQVSRRHAELRKLPDGQFAVRDLGSKNGTFVNGAPISTWVLKPGDTITIGETKIQFDAK
jgi:pSer/pThr/pTyr-binding forkhead associated (FHA) protein